MSNKDVLFDILCIIVSCNMGHTVQKKIPKYHKYDTIKLKYQGRADSEYHLQIFNMYLIGNYYWLTSHTLRTNVDDPCTCACLIFYPVHHRWANDTLCHGVAKKMLQFQKSLIYCNTVK